jgi:trans-2-enoyl-CoA reductase
MYPVAVCSVKTQEIIIRGAQQFCVVVSRPDLDSVKERLKALGADYVLTEEELGSLDKKTLAGRAQAKLGLNCVGGSAATAVMKLLG